MKYIYFAIASLVCFSQHYIVTEAGLAEALLAAKVAKVTGQEFVPLGADVAKDAGGRVIGNVKDMYQLYGGQLKKNGLKSFLKIAGAAALDAGRRGLVDASELTKQYAPEAGAAALRVGQKLATDAQNGQLLNVLAR